MSLRFVLKGRILPRERRRAKGVSAFSTVSPSCVEPWGHATLPPMKRRSTFHTFFMLALSTTTLSLGLLACGDEGTTNTPTAKYTLENVCAQIAPQLCATRENCCLQTGAYDETACITFETGECEKNVADVKAGKMTFDPDSIDPCVVAVKPYADKCLLTIPDYYDAPTDLASCAKVFSGKLAADSVCERTAQCESSLSDKELVTCNTATSKCSTLRFLPKDAPCTISQDITEFCDNGLYCNVNILTQKGTCKAATPVGSACTIGPTGISLECGLGYYCDTTTKLCTDAKPKDAPCSLLLECQSLKCTSSVCEAPAPLYNKEQCTGMP